MFNVCPSPKCSPGSSVTVGEQTGESYSVQTVCCCILVPGQSLSHTVSTL